MNTLDAGQTSGLRRGLVRCARAAALAAFAAGLAGGAAFAQIADSDSDIEVRAANANFDRASCRGEYENDVVAVQGGTTLTTNKLTMILEPPASTGGNCGGVQKFIAEGKVLYSTPNERISSDRAEYDYDSDTIIMTGQVVMSRGVDGVISGTRLVFAVSKGQATVTSNTGPVTSYFPSRRRDDETTP
ncbi:MAG: LptA/OstA family protein [Hyphomonadaceae bacterium]